MQPRYAHDCTDCSFLGQVDKADIYYCYDGELIARYGDEEGDYSAWPVSLVEDGTITGTLWTKALALFLAKRPVAVAV